MKGTLLIQEKAIGISNQDIIGSEYAPFKGPHIKTNGTFTKIEWGMECKSGNYRGALNASPLLSVVDDEGSVRLISSFSRVINILIIVEVIIDWKDLCLYLGTTQRCYDEYC